MIRNSLFYAVGLLLICSCTSQPGKPLPRKGDEIVVAGQLFHTGTPVVLWMDQGGFDGYRVERRFSALDKADWAASHEENKDLHSPNRYDERTSGLTDAQIEQTRGGGWNLALLQDTVDQFVFHYDATGVSRTCFRTLHDIRDLSVHFMLDLDGTIYQTLDLKERARHATVSNNRSVGIEIANIGAFEEGDDHALNEWYVKEKGQTMITIPSRFGENPERTPNFRAHTIRPELIHGEIQGKPLRQYDLTPQQYAALIKLTKTVCAVLPKIKCDYPRDVNGKLITQALSPEELLKFQGLIGHFHIQTNKIDPGPAFQWDYLVSQAKP